MGDKVQNTWGPLAAPSHKTWSCQRVVIRTALSLSFKKLSKLSAFTAFKSETVPWKYRNFATFKTPKFPNFATFKIRDCPLKVLQLCNLQHPRPQLESFATLQLSKLRLSPGSIATLRMGLFLQLCLSTGSMRSIATLSMGLIFKGNLSIRSFVAKLHPTLSMGVIFESCEVACNFEDVGNF